MYYVYTRSGQAVKRKEGPGQTVKSGFRAESSGQDRFQAVKNLDPGRGRSYGKYWSDRPLTVDIHATKDRRIPTIDATPYTRALLY